MARIERRDGIVVLTLRGAVDREAMRRVAPDLPSEVTSGCHVVLDLDEVTLLDAAGLRDLLARLRRSCPEPPAVVCRRSTGRLLLRTWGLDEGIEVHTSLDAAVRDVARRAGREKETRTTTR